MLVKQISKQELQEYKSVKKWWELSTYKFILFNPTGSRWFLYSSSILALIVFAYLAYYLYRINHAFFAAIFLLIVIRLGFAIKKNHTLYKDSDTTIYEMYFR